MADAVGIIINVGKMVDQCFEPLLTAYKDLASHLGSDSAASTRKATSDAFDAIAARIAGVSRSVTEIFSSVAEMQTGGKQILEAMSDRSRHFNAATGNLVEGMDSLHRLSAELVSSIDEISTGISYIGTSVRGIASETERPQEVGAGLEAEIGLFKTASCTDDKVPAKPADGPMPQVSQSLHVQA